MVIGVMFSAEEREVMRKVNFEEKSKQEQELMLVLDQKH